MKDIEDLMARVDTMFRAETPVDTPLERAGRILDYQYNDLKTGLLIELARSGDLVDQELEELLSNDRFHRIEPARPPSIHRAPPMIDDDAFARFFFARPTPRLEADKKLLEGDYPNERLEDQSRFIERAASLFRNFGEVGPRFSMEQVDQGLWYLFGWQFPFSDLLFTCKAPLALQQACVRAMLYPFRDYYARVSGDYTGTFFYMWWDSLRHVGGDWDATEEERSQRRTDVEGVILETLAQILVLPNLDCRDAALHGLNHMHPHPEAIAVVSRYLTENRERMKADEIAWIEACRDGKVM